ncbi:hypothetical protein [Saccharothrix hoggarensis]|uniref:Uncharacterized protein n=1 Tax=Saccharothrix hoggarensis TaxID=913853 RepID=A0ABW3QZC4_9PSEU
MDPRARADAALARARARGIHVVTPDNMTSPMDSSATQQIPRAVVNAADPRDNDPDSTMVLAAHVAAGRPAPQHQPAAQQTQHQAPQPAQQPAAAQQPNAQQQAHQPAPPHQNQQQPPQQQHGPETQELRVAPGPVPTVQQVPTSRPSLSQRLSGGQDQHRPGLSQRLNGGGEG